MFTPWLTRSLRLTDLSTFKLVALGRPDRKTLEQLIPSSVKVSGHSVKVDATSMVV